MTYDEKQMIFTGAATPEESAALALHYEIATAARAAADSLLDLGRKIKRMRDTNGYKALGFETLGDYTKTAIGLNQRQAYNYIAVVEKLPAQLVEQNAAAGVTKLALLAQLTDGERQVVVQPGRRGASRAGGFPDRLDLRWIFFCVIGILVLTLVIFIVRNFSKIEGEGPDE